MSAYGGLSASGAVSGRIKHGQVAGMRIWGGCDFTFTFTESQREKLVWIKKSLENCRHCQRFEDILSSIEFQQKKVNSRNAQNFVDRRTSLTQWLIDPLAFSSQTRPLLKRSDPTLCLGHIHGPVQDVELQRLGGQVLEAVGPEVGLQSVLGGPALGDAQHAGLADILGHGEEEVTTGLARVFDHLLGALLEGGEVLRCDLVAAGADEELLEVLGGSDGSHG